MTKIWVKRNGTEIKINKMNDEHLGNAISMLLRGHDSKGRVVPESRYLFLDDLKEEAQSRKLVIKEEGWDD